METPCLLFQVISGLIPIENNLGLLLALTILEDSVPVEDKTKFDYTFFEFSGAVTLEKKKRVSFIEKAKLKFITSNFDI